MKYIQLTQGKQATVDDEDYEVLTQFKWYYKQGYACRNLTLPTGKRCTQRMHQLVNNTRPGFLTDHINHDRLDNRRSNLRTVNSSQNMWNRSKQKSSSKYKGVYWNTQNQRWHVQIQVDGKGIWLGYYEDEEKAGAAYRKAALHYFGEYMHKG